MTSEIKLEAGLDSYSLNAFTREGEAIIRSDSLEYDVLRRLKSLMERLITAPRAIPPEAFVSRADKFANNLLYRPEDRIFSIMGGNWLPGQTTPIHDHLT